MNKADLKCTVVGVGIETYDSRVKIGTTTWDVELFFANQKDPSTHAPISLDVGNLSSIALNLCLIEGGVEQCHNAIQPLCDPESILGPLEQKYGRFGRNPTHPVSALRRFANGASISFFARIIGDSMCAPVSVHYFNPNVETPPPAPPAATAGHF